MKLDFTQTDSVIEHLKDCSNETEQTRIAKYHKVDREYLGVRVPQIRSVAKLYWKQLGEDELIPVCHGLWDTNIHEARILVGKILEVKKFRSTENVWFLLNEIKEGLDAWAIADHLTEGACRCILDKQSRLDDVEKNWLPHNNFWIRRACLVYTLSFAKKDMDPERSLTWASQMVDDHEWFIQKAIGWWLRELSKHNSNRVISFLEQYQSRMKNFAVKEASKYL